MQARVLRRQGEDGQDQVHVDAGLRLLLVLCLVVAAAALGSFIFAPADHVADTPLSEDGYYALSVSRNLAEGHGLSVDGTTRTNGFQPAFTIVSAIAFIGHPPVEMSLRIVLALHWLLFLGTGLILGQIARDFYGRDSRRGSIALWLAPVLFTTGLFTIQPGFNGLETGALFFAYALAWRHAQTSGLATQRSILVHGALVGLVVLVRIDAVFFVGVYAAFVWWRAGLRRAAMLACTAAFVSSPWWIYNYSVFGSVFPSSAKAQQEWLVNGARLRVGFQSLVEAMVPWMSSRRLDILLPPARLVILAIGAVLIGRALRKRRQLESRSTWDFATALVLTYLVLGAWYVLSSWAVHFYPRYLAPVLLPSVVALTVIAIEYFRKFIALASVSVTVLAVAGIFGRFPTNLDRSNLMLHDQLTLVRDVVPADQMVGAGQSGTLGFFRSDVLNLDGKVNAEAIKARDAMARYVSENGVNWLCDWDPSMERIVSDDVTGWHRVEWRGDFVCWTRNQIPSKPTP